MKMKPILLGTVVFILLGAEENDFTVQLPPISATVTIEEVDLAPLEKWEAADEPASGVTNYLLPLLENDLVVSVPMPEVALPKTVKVEPTDEGEEK